MPSFLVPDDAQLHWMNYLKGGTLPGKLEVGSPKSYVSIPIGFSLGLLLAFGLRLENQGGARVRVREPDLGRAARHRIGILSSERGATSRGPSRSHGRARGAHCAYPWGRPGISFES